MAEAPRPILRFRPGCPDCGVREVKLPDRPAAVGDDFDWQVRDYDSFRMMMLEELAARFPERRRWTAADLEVVLIEVLAAVLDQLSDMADRVATEGYLQTARRPETVYELLRMIGYDAAVEAALKGGREELLSIWAEEPTRMESARLAGPGSVRRQQRMATLADYADRVTEHPLVKRSQASIVWGGSSTIVQVAVTLLDDKRLDKDNPIQSDQIRNEVNRFHRERALPEPAWDSEPTIRAILHPYVERYRMIGQEVVLKDAHWVGLALGLSVQVDPAYFRSEVRRAIETSLGRGPDGFFRPGRLRFGEDVWASDIFQWLMRLDGVSNVCLNRFKRVGRQHPDQTAKGRIQLDGLEIAVCDNDPDDADRGYNTLKLHGGRRG